MNTRTINILLADDDKDDRLLFKEALEELAQPTTLETVHDGEQLMSYLAEHSEKLPDVLFLDLNMPRKNGFECLSEIKFTEEWKDLPVIMFSTSFPRDVNYEQDMIKMLYKIGAHDYIRKPANYNELKDIIERSLAKIDELMSK
ncbi:MAG: response regulator [Bacteroidetes bacterium]|nr:response regulator [Bacteroidota bacterium]